jgi:hypothetical protein
MLILDTMRAEFARYLAEEPAGHHRMDRALGHVLTLAYERGLDDGRRSQPAEYPDAVRVLRSLLDPEALGHAVTEEVRNAARRALGMTPL